MSHSTKHVLLTLNLAPNPPTPTAARTSSSPSTRAGALPPGLPSWPDAIMGMLPCPPPPRLSSWPIVHTWPSAVAMAEWRLPAMEVTCIVRQRRQCVACVHMMSSVCAYDVQRMCMMCSGWRVCMMCSQGLHKEGRWGRMRGSCWPWGWPPAQGCPARMARLSERRAVGWGRQETARVSHSHQRLLNATCSFGALALHMAPFLLIGLNGCSLSGWAAQAPALSSPHARAPAATLSSPSSGASPLQAAGSQPHMCTHMCAGSDRRKAQAAWLCA